MNSDWTGNEDYNSLIKKGLEKDAKEIIFAHPDKEMLHAQMGVFLLRYIQALRKAGVIDNKNLDAIHAASVDAITDQFSDKFIEILEGKRAFNW